MAQKPKMGAYEAQCMGKLRFSSKKYAKRALRRTRARRRKLVAYPCPHCGGFHIGGEG